MSKRPLSRSVSIIGVGITKFGDADATPELLGMSLQDMAVWACLDAMEDAGVNPQQIGKLVVGRVCTTDGNSECISPNHGFLEWVGMRGKAGVHHSEACATPFNILNEAIEDVASGRFDISMCVDSDSARHITAPDQPSHITYPKSEYKTLYGRDAPTGDSCQDTAFNRWIGGGFAQLDSIGRQYIRTAGITQKDLDDALNGQSITARHHGKMNPKAFVQETWEEIAEKRGFDDPRKYLESKYNPPISEYLRPSTFAMLSEGAAALIVCATEIADQFRQNPIEIVNFAQFDVGQNTPFTTSTMNTGLAKQLYEITGYKPEDIEYFQTTDGTMPDVLDSAEAFGYLPKGEGWKYLRDGKTRFDGEKPMNTDGGHQCYGHAFGATGVATVGECVMQMRGTAGPRQITPAPKVSAMRGWGSGQSVSGYIFKTSDVTPKNPGMKAPHYDPKPLTKMFYEGVDEGKFLGMKCRECGHIEFPLYPTCSKCGHYDNEIVETSGDVTVAEIFRLGPAFTTPDFSMYTPLFVCEGETAEGSGFISLLFGVTEETYPQLRDSVPIKGRLVVLQKNGYKTFAVGINGAVPVAHEAAGATEEYSKFKSGKIEDIASKYPDGVKYNFVAKVAGQAREGEMTLEIKGEAIIGEVTVLGMSMPLEEGGLIKNNAFEFSVSGRGMLLTFNGKFDGDKISGEILGGPAAMEFEGQRANGDTPVCDAAVAEDLNREDLMKAMAQKLRASGGHPIDGIYNFTAKAMGRSQKGKLTIMAEDNKLIGVIDIMDAAAELKDGKLSGDNYEFSFEARGTKLTFSGIIGGGKISGTAKMGAIKMKLEGVRE